VLSGVRLSNQISAASIDAAVRRNYTLLSTSGAISSSDDCMTKFANFMCLQGVYGCDAQDRQTAITPCLQRCVDYQMACLGMSSDSAGKACAQSAGVMNAADNSACFCGNTGSSGMWYDVCTATCDPLSDCGKSIACKPTTGVGLKFCAVLDGTNFVTNVGGQAIDAARAADFKAALSASPPIQNTPDCSAAYSGFMCTQGVIGCTTTGTTSLQTTLLPCLQRCLDYQTKCLGATALAAALACAQTAGTMNSPNNSDCFCGNSGTGGAWFDQCNGPCHPMSECGKSILCTLAVPSDLPYCLVLAGVGLGAEYSGSAIDAKALSEYMTVASAGLVAATDKCKMAYASFMCPQQVVGCTVKVNHYLRTSLLPCFQRCVDYEVACLEKTQAAAVVACQASAGTKNTDVNADCFCGNESPVGSPFDICVGTCNPLVVCGQFIACTPAIGPGYGFCGVLNGTNLTSLSAGTSQDSSALATYTSLAASGSVSNTAECRAKYAAFMCMQGIVGCTAQGTIAVQTTLLPCLQRCVDYQVACKSLSPTGALAACALTAGVMNTADNADCFCGAGSGRGVAAPTYCVGACKAPSECRPGKDSSASLNGAGFLAVVMAFASAVASYEGCTA
jgi:hypothetical protein